MDPGSAPKGRMTSVVSWVPLLLERCWKVSAKAEKAGNDGWESIKMSEDMYAIRATEAIDIVIVMQC